MQRFVFVKNTQRRETKEQIPLLTLLYSGRIIAQRSTAMSLAKYLRTWFTILCAERFKVQIVWQRQASGFDSQIYFFVFKLTSLVLNRVPICVRKPKTNTFDESIKFLHWLFLVALGRFSSHERLLNVLFTFSLLPVFRGSEKGKYYKNDTKKLCSTKFSQIEMSNQFIE